MEILLDFDNGADATRSLKKVAQMMLRAGQPVISTDFDAKVKRTSGISYREALLTVASGQTVTLLVKQTGDIYQVKINGKVTPIKNQDDSQKAIVEIANHLDANQAKFQAQMAKTKVDLKETGAKSVAPKMEEKLTAQLAELDTKIADARKKLETGVFDSAYYDKDDKVGESITGDGDSDLDDDDKKKKKKDNEDTYVDPEEDEALDAVGGYEVLHNTFTSAINTALKEAEKKGYDVDEDDVWQQISTGTGKPKAGQTFKANIGLTKGGKPQKKALQIQVYNRESDSKPYELNVYIL